MPEGPEVRTMADKLAATLIGKLILGVWMNLDDGIEVNGDLNIFTGSRIVSINSYGKKLMIHTDNKMSLVASLGMTGRFSYKYGKHTRIALQYDSDSWVFFEDSRKFGHIDICPTTYVSTLLRDLGPDLLAASLGNEIPLELWMSRFPFTSTRKIFEVIKDQSTVAGIGNYLASEILYYSSIHPLRQARSLTILEWDKLRQVAHQVIRLSYSYGGFTIESFLNPDGSPGLYPAAVYGKANDSQGYLIITQKIGSQTAYFAPQVQLI